MKEEGAPGMELTRVKRELLRRCVGEVLRDRFAAGASLHSIEARASEHRGHHASHILTATLTDGRKLMLFLKDYGSFRFEREDMSERRTRELLTYRSLLTNVDLGTPAYYGSVWDEPDGPFWLLLEFVEGTSLRYSDYEHWVSAAAWLGRLHGFFFRQQQWIRSLEFLERRDEVHFVRAADLVEACVVARSGAAARRLAPTMRRFRDAATLMAAGPHSLQHGSYRASQIVVDHREDPPRIRPVDWERAGVGCAFYDLAFLADGFKGPRLRQILGSYRSEATSWGLPVPDLEELGRLVDLFRLYWAMRRLTKHSGPSAPETVFNRLLDSAEDVAEAVG